MCSCDPKAELTLDRSKASLGRIMPGDNSLGRCCEY